MNAESFHPWSQKFNTAKNEMMRARRNSSNPQLEQRSISMISDLLQKNGFSHKTIRKLIYQTKTPSNRSDFDNKTNFLVLPYLGESLKRRTHDILRKHNLQDQTRLISTSGPKVKDTLSKTCLLATLCNSRSPSTCYDCGENCCIKNIVYILIVSN